MNVDQLLPHDISHRLRLLEVLDRITQVGLAGDNMEDVLSGVLDLVLEVFNADRAWFLYPCDPDALSWGVPMERSRPEWPGLFVLGADIPMDREVVEIFRELLMANGTIQYGPGTGHPVPLIIEQFSVKSQLMIALRPKIGKTWAFGLHHCASEVIHDEKDLHLFTAVARRITDSLSSLISIRQQRESEAKYRLLIESLQEGIWMIDKNACTSFVNQRMAQMLGYSVEEMQGKHLFSFMDKRGKEIAAQNLERRKQEISEQHDFELLRKDGSRIYTSMATSTILDEAGNYAGALAGVTDITERKLLENELLASRQLLRNLAAKAESLREEELKHIAREMHDELGQILTALRMDITLINLRFGEQNAPLLEKTQGMTALLDQAGRCVHDIVLHLRPTALDMGIVSAVRWLCNEHAARTGSSCVLHTIEEHVELDEARAVAIFRIVQELLTNAARYADASSVKITLARHADDLHVVVSDNGKGFDPAAATIKKSYGLLGIRERAIALGGDVMLVSAPNQGTAVTIIVPTEPNGGNK